MSNEWPSDKRQTINEKLIMHRRKFIKETGTAAAAVTILNFPIFGKMAPSNKVIVTVMGVNSRGAYLAKSFATLPDVEVAYICDVEDKAIQNGLDAVKDRKSTRLNSSH